MRNAHHYIAVTILVAIVTVATYFALLLIGPLPLQASTQSLDIDWLLNLEMQLTGFFFAIIVVPLFYSLFVFRRKKGETSDGEHFEGHSGLEITWIAVPLIVVVWLGIIGADNLRKVTHDDPQAMQVTAIAFQWEWQFVYPQGFTDEKLYLPVDRPVLINMESRDVIHSFWVPEFRIKQDIVPGRIMEYRVTPNRVGTYKVRCAELCGTAHSTMEEEVIVMEQAKYDAWLAQRTAEAVAAQATEAADPNPSATRGERRYSENGCKACHSLDGSHGIGPTWKGLYESEVKLADGSTVIADDAFLFESIKEPNAKIVAGFNVNAMPDFGLPDRQIADLVAFIKTLK